VVSLHALLSTGVQNYVIIIIIIHEFHRDASLEQNFSAVIYMRYMPQCRRSELEKYLQRFCKTLLVNNRKLHFTEPERNGVI